MKASGSYVSLLQGVSEQIPQERGQGRCGEQVNMLPDPVRGLTRRHGTQYLKHSTIGTGWTPEQIAAAMADVDNWVTLDYTSAGVTYVVLLRRSGKVAGSPLPGIVVFNRDTNEFLPVVTSGQALVDTLLNGGAAAATFVGRFMFAAPWAAATAAAPVDQIAQHAARSAIWVRGGAYNRTFTVTATKAGGGTVTASYTTPTASYPGVLDTSNIPAFVLDPAGGATIDTEGAVIQPSTVHPGYGQHTAYYQTWAPDSPTVKRGGFTTLTNVYPAFPTNDTEYRWDLSDRDRFYFHSSLLNARDVSVTYTHWKVIANPNYQTEVNEATNAHTSAVTAWIADAATKTSAEYIVGQLRDQLVAGGCIVHSQVGSTVVFNNVTGLEVSDGGDGTLFKACDQEVSDPSELPPWHYAHKVVRVRPKNSSEVYYVKFTLTLETGTATYKWVEAGRYNHQITETLVMGVVKAGTFYLASTAAALGSLISEFSSLLPQWYSQDIGDNDTNPLPYFIGKQITYLGVFQDRLLIGCGGVIRASQTGEYLRVMRSTVLTLPANDAFEMLAQGAEDDVIRYGMIYNRDLVLFGDKRQYIISGRVPLTPTNANMSVLSQHKHATDAQPVGVGNLIVYAQHNGASTALHQIAPASDGTEQPESNAISPQLDNYIAGKVVEGVSFQKPQHLFFRSTGNRSALFAFSYLDLRGKGRVQDAWHRLEWKAALGPICGVHAKPDGLVVFFLRQHGTSHSIVADFLPLRSDLSTLPYLDSLRTHAAVLAGTTDVNASSSGEWIIAFDSSSNRRFIGADLSDAAELLAEFPGTPGAQVGHLMEAYYAPSNPWVRDKNDKVITTGRLTITRLVVSTNDSSGYKATLNVEQRAPVVTEYTARVLNNAGNVVGEEPVADTISSLPIGAETRAYTLRIAARKWLPLTLSAIEWIGQWFNRTQRP